MSDDFLEEFDKLSGFENSAAFGGAQSGAFDFDGEDEMKFNKSGVGNSEKRRGGQPDSMNDFKFGNPMSMADDLLDLKSLEESKGTKLPSNILDFNPTSIEDRNRKTSSPNTSNFLQIPSSATLRNPPVQVTKSPKEIPKESQPKKTTEQPKITSQTGKTNMSFKPEKPPAQAHKQPATNTQTSKKALEPVKKPTPSVSTQKAPPSNPNSKPTAVAGQKAAQTDKGRPGSAVPEPKAASKPEVSKPSPRKDKGNLPGIILTRPEIPKLEMDPLLATEDEKGQPAFQQPKAEGTQPDALAKMAQDDFADFDDFEAEFAHEDGLQNAPPGLPAAPGPAGLNVKTVNPALEEPTDMQVGVFDGMGDDPNEGGDNTKKNKFLNVHEANDDFDEDFGIASNAISDQVGSEVPKVNLENSGVSNRNFDEKMISTVNSEQIESHQDQKSKKVDDGNNLTAKKAMEGIKEVSGDNSNSQNKTSSNNQRKNKIENTDLVTSGPEEPLNQPTFLDNSKEIKPQFKNQPREISDRKPAGPNSKNSIPVSFQKKANERPQSSTGGSKPKQKPADELPAKKARLPDFGLKTAKLPKQITVEALLSQAGVEQPAEKPDDFGALLNALTKQVKRELKENIDKQGGQPFREKKDNEVQRELLERERLHVMKAFLTKTKLDEDEKRKKEIEEAKQKLEEFKKKNGVQYPTVKVKPKPPVVQPTKPSEPAKDLIAEANNFIRSGAWKKSTNPTDKKITEEKKDAKVKEGGELFEVAEAEEGANNMPGINPDSNQINFPEDDYEREELDQNEKDKNPESDFNNIEGDIGLANLAENHSETFFNGIPKDMEPKKSPSSGKNKAKTLHKSSLAVTNEKKAVFENYKQKEAERAKRAEEALMVETWDKRVKKTKVDADRLEEKFRIAQDLEQKEKRERVDKYLQGHNTLRYGKQALGKSGSQVETASKKHAEFRVRVGTGLAGPLVVKEETNEQRDIKFRALEVAKAHQQSVAAKEREKQLFKERLLREKQYLQERTLKEQEYLKSLQAEKLRKKKGDDKEPAEEENKPTVNAFYEESVEGDQAFAPGEAEKEGMTELQDANKGPHLKMKHSLKLKAFIQKLLEVNQGMIDQIKQRDFEYDQLKKEYEGIIVNQRKEEEKEKRAIIESALKKMPVIKLFDLLRGESSLVRTAQIGRQFRDSDELSMVEKKALKELFSSCGHELLTYNQFEAILKEDELRENFKIAKGAAEIEEDKKLAKFIHQLEDYGERIVEFRSIVDSRHCDSFDAYNKILILKKEQLSFMVSIPQMMESLSSRLNALINSMSKYENDDQILQGFEEVDQNNREKLSKLQNVYQDALNDFDETDTRLKNMQLFDIKDFEEHEKKERSLAAAAFEATQTIHQIGFKQKNDILNFLAFAGKKKKSALLVQSWFRGWKARKLYGKKKTFRQRLWYLANRWIRKFRKRAATKMIPELLDSYYRAKLHVSFSRINQDYKTPPFERNLSELTIKMLASRDIRNNLTRVEFINTNKESQIHGEQALPGFNSRRESIGSAGKDRHGDSEVEEKTETHASESLEQPRGDQITTVDGRMIYFSLILQRYYRYFRKKANPGVFFVSPYEAIDKCRLCKLAPVRVVVPENHICLYCWTCFSEHNAHHKKTRKFKLLKVDSKRQRGLSETLMVERAKVIFHKITKVKDFEVLCRAWDYESTGLIGLEDLDLLVDRLKMITQTEKRLFIKVCSALQTGGHVEYAEIIGSLGG